jgi:hypothetical protein
MATGTVVEGGASAGLKLLDWAKTALKAALLSVAAVLLVQVVVLTLPGKTLAASSTAAVMHAVAAIVTVATIVFNYRSGGR